MSSKRLQTITYTVVFILVTIIIGFISFTNLVNFYVNDEVDYNEWTADLGNKFETDEATTFFEKFQFININGAARNALGQREMNGILKLENGHLISPQERMSNEEIKEYADEVIEYAAFCKSLGKPFLFVQTIPKVDANNKQLPVGTEDYSNENVDVFLHYLRAADIDVLDIRECMKKDSMDIYDYTYITDHHWTTEGAFYTFTQITKWIEQETGVAAPSIVTDINNYEIKTYKRWHLGSFGQRVGEYFTGIDDYDLIIPAFNVSFVDGDGNSHSFYEQAVNSSVFEQRDPKSRYTYDRALGIPGGIATTASNLSVLFVTDSYATAMAPYLKLAYSDYYYQYYPSGFNANSVVQLNTDVVVMMPYIGSTFNAGAVFHDVTD